MKKSKAVKTISLIALPLPVFLLIYSFLIYPRINYYEPVTLSLLSEGKDVTDVLAADAITPFNRTVPFYLKKQDKQRALFLDYSFVKEIRITLPDTLLKNEFKLTLIIGKTLVCATNENFLMHFKPSETGEGSIRTYTLIAPATRKNYFKALFSILLWSLFGQFFSKHMLAVIITFSIIIFGLYHRKNIFNGFNDTRIYTQWLLKLILLCFNNVLIWLVYKELIELKNNGLRYTAGFNAFLFYLTMFLIILILAHTFLYLCHTSRRIKQNIYLSIITVFLCVSVAEISLRTIEFNANYYELNFGYYGPSPYDNTHARALYVYDKDSEISFKKKEFSHYRKTNHLGLCDRDYAQHKSDTVFRIIVFGDSFTEGVGVTADKTWVKLLEGKLNAEGLKYEVFNAGISGSDPFFGFYLLKNELISYKPDMVLLAVNPSDINDIIVRGGFERFGTNNSVVYNKPPWWEILYAHSYVLRTVLHQGLGYDNNLMSKNDHDINQKKALKDLLKVSVWYKKLAEHRNFEFYTVIHPDFTSVFEGMYNGLGDYGNELKKLQINYIDILPVFLKDLQKKETMYSLFWPVDKHYTEKGQELMAEEIFKSIKNELNK